MQEGERFLTNKLMQTVFLDLAEFEKPKLGLQIRFIFHKALGSVLLFLQNPCLLLKVEDQNRWLLLQLCYRVV